MKRVTASLLLTALVLPVLGGCAMDRPTFDGVRGEALDSLERIAKVIPGPKEVEPQAEGKPYPCDDPLLLSNRDGAFHTGHWIVHLPEGFDVDGFINTLPGLLGEDWEVRAPAIDVSFANVDLLYKPGAFTVSVEDALAESGPALELLVISRCGILPTDDKPRRSPGGRGS